MHLIRKLGSSEGLVMFFFLSSCLLTIKSSIYNYPLHKAKVYEHSEYIEHVLLKSNKILLFVFLFLFFFKTKLGRESCQ